MSKPTEIRAGDTYTWTVTSSDYPATDGWTLRIVIQNDAVRLKVDAATSGSDYAVTLTSANTDDLTSAGTYQITEAVEKGTGASLERHTLYLGTINVLKDIVTGTAAVDARTDARIMLDTITATIKANLGKPQESMSIAARAIGYRSWEEMLKARQRLTVEVKGEEQAQAAAAGLATALPIRTRFSGVV